MFLIAFVRTEIFCKTKFVLTGFVFKWRVKLPTLKSIFSGVDKALVWVVPSVLSDRLHLTWFVLYLVVLFDSYFLFPAFYCQPLLLPVFVIWISALFYLIVLFFISASSPESCLWALFCKPWQVTSTHNIPVRKPTDVKCLLFPFMVFSGCFLVSWQCSLCFPPVLLPPPDFPFTPSLHQCN